MFWDTETIETINLTPFSIANFAEFRKLCEHKMANGVVKAFIVLISGLARGKTGRLKLAKPIK